MGEPKEGRGLGDLLSEIATRVDGAVDYCTLVCMLPETHATMRDGTVEQNRSMVYALLHPLETQLNKLYAQHVGVRNCDTQGIRDTVLVFYESLLQLCHHRTMSAEAMNDAIARLTTSYQFLMNHLTDIQDRWNVRIAYFERRNTARIPPRLAQKRDYRCSTGLHRQKRPPAATFPDRTNPAAQS